MTGRYLAEFRRPLVVAGIAAVGLVSSYVIAVQRPLPSSEIDLTDLINDVPGWVATALYPVMQMGTFAGPIIVAALIAIFRRDLVLSAAVVVTGLVTWFAAKWVKKIVERGRPLTYIPDIVVREGDGTGLGYISGSQRRGRVDGDHGHGGPPASMATRGGAGRSPGRDRPHRPRRAPGRRRGRGLELRRAGGSRADSGWPASSQTEPPPRDQRTGCVRAADSARVRPATRDLRPAQPPDRLVSAQVRVRAGGARAHRRHGDADEPRRRLEVGHRDSDPSCRRHSPRS